MAECDAVPVWWGGFRLAQGETDCWRVGGLRLWLQRERRGLRTACCRADAGHSLSGFDHPCAEPWPAAAEEEQRFLLGSTGERFLLDPRLPDRPVVWRPREVLSLPVDEETSLYLRIPLWLVLRIEGKPPALLDLPLRHLSETWFGGPADRGGAAYAADRQALIDAGELPHDPLHAVVPIRVHNAAPTTLCLDRLNVPVPWLSLFQGDAGGLWTQRIMLRRDESETGLAQLRLGNGPPEEAGQCRRLAGPRLTAETNVVFHAFSRIFH